MLPAMIFPDETLSIFAAPTGTCCREHNPKGR
jgi:hypothetical protein